MNSMGTTDFDIKHLFKELLVTMWLRPERALIEAHMGAIVYKHFPKVSGKSLEWGCVDGTISFAALGGKFNFQYDDYLEVEWVNNEKRKKTGINLDFFDIVADTLIDPVSEPANFIFSNGVSWKESHISKAARLRLHNDLISQDFNSSLPFLNNYFDFILATNLFWIEKREDLSTILMDLNRTLQKNGRLLTVFPMKVDKKNILANSLKGADEKWINMIDRGISKNLQYNAFELSEAEKLFELAGFRIINTVEYCPSLISTIYQIGFRPMFPVFMNMYEKLKFLSPSTFLEYKAQWIDTVCDFMLPLCETEWMKNFDMPNTWQFFELEKSY
jgi:hypothetical protein